MGKGLAPKQPFETVGTGPRRVVDPPVGPTTPPQRGAVLFTSLVMLLLLTIIGVTAMSNTTLQERMAGSFRDRDLAFEAGETALRAAEDWLDGHTAAPGLGELASINRYSQLNAPELQDIAEEPEVTIGELQYLPDSYNTGQQGDDVGRTYYRIEVRAVGGSDAARAVLTSTYARSD